MKLISMQGLGYDENDVIGIGVDLDDDILTFYKNGVRLAHSLTLQRQGKHIAFSV